MPELTEEQKLYIKEHPKESPSSIARKLGVYRQYVYYWLHRFHGKEFIAAKNEDMCERRKIVLEMYPLHSGNEIAKILGVTREAVNSMARRLGVKHTEETSRRLMRKFIEGSMQPDVKGKRTEKIRNIIAMERLRVASGKKQLTRRKVIRQPNRSMCARRYLISKYNYFYDQEICEPLTIFYDEETKRLPPEREQYYTDTYHLRFEEAG